MIKTPPEQGQPRFFSVADVAKIFGTSRMTIYRAIREGEMPAVHVRGRLFIPARVLDAMVDAALSARTAAPNEGVAP